MTAEAGRELSWADAFIGERRYWICRGQLKGSMTAETKKKIEVEVVKGVFEHQTQAFWTCYWGAMFDL